MLPQELVDAITPAFALKVTRLRILEHMGFHLTGRTQDVDGVAGAEVELANFDTLVGAAGDPEANGEKLADLARRR